MKLSRHIPARTLTLHATACRKDFLIMSPSFRAIRSKSRNPMDTCHWCNHPFADGEMMALAVFEKIGNRTLCGTCADKLLASE